MIEYLSDGGVIVESEIREIVEKYYAEQYEDSYRQSIGFFEKVLREQSEKNGEKVRSYSKQRGGEVDHTMGALIELRTN